MRLRWLHCPRIPGRDNGTDAPWVPFHPMFESNAFFFQLILALLCSHNIWSPWVFCCNMETPGAGNYRSWIDWKFSLNAPLGGLCRSSLCVAPIFQQKSNMSWIIWAQQAVLGLWIPVYPTHCQINDGSCTPLLSPQLCTTVVNWK